LAAPSPSLLAAARDAAGHQHYPQGTLYMVATPIGNLADLGLRALQVLSLVDSVACEDTRHTASLLQACGLHKPMLSLHEHNEAEAAQAVVARLREGQRVAYVSDAGTPGVSDPGARLVAEAMAAGLRCVPVPGASSITALLSVAGEAGWDGRFVFAGFLSPKAAERQRAVLDIGADRRGCVLLEAPHRIEALARDLATLGERSITVGRELTKQFEEVARLEAQAFPAWLAQDANRTRGEFVLLVHPRAATADHDTGVDAAAQRVLALLLEELPLKTAVRLCAEITGAPRNALYDAALALREASGDGTAP
jgi:16S rRNA (cytidine1402-2'-O)-methyltransferase